MDYGSILASLFFLALGCLLTLLAVWFRIGTSRAARWWVRRGIPLERMSFAASASEGVALGMTPYLAQLMWAVALIAATHVHPGVRDAVFQPVMWTVVIAEQVLALIVLVPISNRRILPLFIYPAWLRPTRREERQYLNSL